MAQRQRERRPVPDALRYVYSALVGLLFVAVAPIFPLLALLPGVLGFFYHGMGRRFFITAAAVWSLGCAAWYGLTPSLPWYALALPCGLAIGLMLEKQAPYRTMAAGLSVFLGLWLYWQICLPSLLLQGDPFALSKEILGGFFDELAARVGQTYLDAGAAATLSSYFYEAKAAIPALVAGGAVYLSMGLAGLDALVAQRLSRRAGKPLRPMAPLGQWRLGKGFFAGSCILAAGALILWLNKVSYAPAAIAALQAIVFAQLILNGACALEFYLQRRTAGAKRRRGALIAIGVLFFPTSLYLLGGIGLFDYISKNPRRLPPEGKDI